MMIDIETRAIIIAAGDATRWGNYLGVPKHFIEVDGEPIIHRTVRLLNEYGVDDVWVVGKDDRYDIEGSKLFVPPFNPGHYDADKFLNSRELWLEHGRTLVLYGDVYFTEFAMFKIMNPPADPTQADRAPKDRSGWYLYARPFGSQITGNGDGECFAQAIMPNDLKQHERELFNLVDDYNSGRLGRIGGWEHYRRMIGLPENMLHRHLVGDNLINIDDWTDDFDTPQSYESFVEARKHRHFVKGLLRDGDKLSALDSGFRPEGRRRAMTSNPRRTP